ncbi:division abnormally delayed protein-like isoform X2 [Lucilia sericata]|nr:division abnormally delayed protein-like isoform X2 [Lucilia sericata]
MALKQNLSSSPYLNNTLLKFTIISVILVGTFVVSTSAKNLDLDSQQQQQLQHHSHHHSHNRRLQRRDSTLTESANQHCNEVRDYFESIDIQLPQHFNEKGK